MSDHTPVLDWNEESVVPHISFDLIRDSIQTQTANSQVPSVKRYIWPIRSEIRFERKRRIHSTLSLSTTLASSIIVAVRAAERHLPYGITQCYLPPDTGERGLP